MSGRIFVFVLMPFDQKFDDIYKLGIKAACKELSLYCERVDEQIFTENILDEHIFISFSSCVHDLHVALKAKLKIDTTTDRRFVETKERHKDENDLLE